MNTNKEMGGNNLGEFSAQITAAVENATQSVAAIDARSRVATSGIVWRDGGIIVSTNHTIRRDENITVALENGKTASATLIGRDAGTDLAVLKIDDEEIAKTLKPAEIAATSEIKVGNFVVAVGRTGAESGVSASFGIISQFSGAWRAWGGDEIERFIGLDLAIRLGFSGGALLNTEGKVLGINTSAFGRGLALTIPSETVNRVTDVLLTKGSVARPYLGIGTQTVPLSESLREKLDLEQASGLMLLMVEADGAAEKAGMLIGDVLLSIDEKPTLEPMDVQAALWDKSPGEVINAKVLRGGELKKIEIALGARPGGESGARRRRYRDNRDGRGWKRGGWQRGGCR